jgi:hypothetical protein
LWARAEAHVMAHLELYLSAVVLVIVVVLPLALELGTDVQELAGAALAACLFQATAHWALRRRADAARKATIAQIRALLRDRINNHLQIVLFSLTEDGGGSRRPEDRERLTLAIAAVNAVSRTLEELSIDSLRRWQDRYGTALNGAANGDGNGADSGTGGTAAGR